MHEPPVEEFCMRGAGTHTQLSQPWHTIWYLAFWRDSLTSNAKNVRFVYRVLKGWPSRSVIIKFSLDFKEEDLYTVVKMDVSENSFAQ